MLSVSTGAAALIPRFPVIVSPALFTGVYVRAVVTSLEVNVTAPVRVLKLATPPAAPEEAAVIRPLESTVKVGFVYDPAVTPETASVVANDPVPVPVTSPVSVIV